MSKVLPWIIVILLIVATAWVVWEFKPPEYVKGDVVHDTIAGPDTAFQSLKKALQGKLVITDREGVEKYGKRIWDIKDSLRIRDSLHIDTIHYSIPTLSASDTNRYSGFNLLNDDTARVDFRINTAVLALLAPINAIEINTKVDSVIITVPPRPPDPEPTILQVVIKWWEWFAGVFLAGFILGS